MEETEATAASQGSNKVSLIRLGGLVILALGLAVFRQVAVVVGDLPVNLIPRLDVGLAAIFVAISIWLIRQHGLTVIAGVLAAATAVVALLQLVLPTTPVIKAAGGCDGARLSRADFLATTHPNGVTARSGPGRSFRPTYRFAGDCTLGFVSYCLGEPVLDEFVVPRVHDARWLQLPKGVGWVSAAAVRAQRPDTVLERSGDCPPVIPEREEPSLVIRPLPATGETLLTAEASNAFTVGFAALADTLDPETPYIRRIALDTFYSDAFEGNWVTSNQITAGGGIGQGSVLVAAVVCYAGEVPSTLVDARVVDVVNPGGRPGTSSQNRSYEDLSSVVAERLRRTACLVPDPPSE